MFQFGRVMVKCRLSQRANFACTSVVRLVAKANSSKITWQKSKTAKVEKIFTMNIKWHGVDLRQIDYKVNMMIFITTIHQCLSTLVVKSTLSTPLSPTR